MSDFFKKVQERIANNHRAYLRMLHPTLTRIGPVTNTTLLTACPSFSTLKDLVCMHSHLYQGEESKSREEKEASDEKTKKHAILAAIGAGLTVVSMGFEHYMSRPSHELAYIFEEQGIRAKIVHQTERENDLFRAHFPLLHVMPRQEKYSTKVSAQMGDWYCEGTIDDHTTSVEPEYFSSVRLKNRHILSGRLRTFGLEACMGAFTDHKK